MTKTQTEIRRQVRELAAELEASIREQRGILLERRNFPRAYVPNFDWRDGWGDLLAAEVADEKGHRGFMGGYKDAHAHPYPVKDAAHLQVLHWVGQGGERFLKGEPAPTVLELLNMRENAIKCEAIGYELAAARVLSLDWIRRACALDYCAAVQS